jgi:hypothetical protein
VYDDGGMIGNVCVEKNDDEAVREHRLEPTYLREVFGSAGADRN